MNNEKISHRQEKSVTQIHRGGVNTDLNGNSRCIRANYYKMSMANLIHKDGRAATFVMEIWKEK